MTHVLRWIATAFALLCVPPCPAARNAGATAQPHDPATVRAAFILNFITYVKWPAGAFPDADAPLVVAATPGSDYEALYTALHGATSAGRTLRVVLWAPEADLPACHVLVALDKEGDAPAAAIRASASTPVLVVTERPGLAEAGGVINFTQRGTRLGFEINAAEAANRRLTPSSHLLRLGTVVGAPPQPDASR